MNKKTVLQMDMNIEKNEKKNEAESSLEDLVFSHNNLVLSLRNGNGIEQARQNFVCLFINAGLDAVFEYEYILDSYGPIYIDDEILYAERPLISAYAKYLKAKHFFNALYDRSENSEKKELHSFTDDSPILEKIME